MDTSKAILFDQKTERLLTTFHKTRAEELPMTMAKFLKGGYTPMEIMDMFFLDAVRVLQPYYYLSGEMHCLLIVQTFRLMARDVSPAETVHAVMLVAEYYKKVLARYRNGKYFEPGMVARPIDKSLENPAAVLESGMNEWDLEAAEKAVGPMVQAGLSDQVFRMLIPYAVRDFRRLGHKVIYMANAGRVFPRLQEPMKLPVFRSLMRGFLLKIKSETPEQRRFQDTYHQKNLERIATFPENWEQGRPDPKITRNLVEAFYTEDIDYASDLATRAIQSGCGPRAIWDGVFCGAAELLLRNPPDIVTKHAVTTANAYYTCYQQTESAETRKYILLQAVSSIVAFIHTVYNWPSELNQDRILDVKAQKAGGMSAKAILAVCKQDRKQGMGLVMDHIKNNPEANELIQALGSNIVAAAQDIHDFKFGWAVFEDLKRISAEFRPYYFYAAMGTLKLAREEPTDYWANHPHKLDRGGDFDRRQALAVKYVMS